MGNVTRTPGIYRLVDKGGYLKSYTVNSEHVNDFLRPRDQTMEIVKIEGGDGRVQSSEHRIIAGHEWRFFERIGDLPQEAPIDDIKPLPGIYKLIDKRGWFASFWTNVGQYPLFDFSDDIIEIDNVVDGLGLCGDYTLIGSTEWRYFELVGDLSPVAPIPECNKPVTVNWNNGHTGTEGYTIAIGAASIVITNDQRIELAKLLIM